MEHSQENPVSNIHVRHFIYNAFAETTRPPTTEETAEHFNISISTVENAYEDLADAHHIALAPGSHSKQELIKYETDRKFTAFKGLVLL